MTWSSFLIDFILVIIIGFSVFVSFKRGFVATIIGTLGFFLAVILSLTFSTPLANATYDKFVEPVIVEAVSDEVEEKFEDKLDAALGENANLEKFEEVKNEISASGEELIASMPQYIRNYIKQAGLVVDELFSGSDADLSADDTVNEASEKVAVNISQNKIKPIVSSVISTIFSVLLLH